MPTQSQKNLKAMTINNILLAIYPLYLALIGGSIFVSYNFWQSYDSKITISKDSLIRGAQQYLYPEPAEQLTFMLAALLIPFLSILMGFLVVKYIKNLNFIVSSFWSATLSFLLMFIFLYPLNGSDFLMALNGNFGGVPVHVIRWWLLCCVLSIVAFRILSIRGAFSKTSPLIDGLNILVLVVVVLQCIAWRILWIEEVDLADSWWRHLDPIMFTLSQVAGGKITLIDFPSMYGLFPEFFRPIFAFFPISILVVTLTFGLLQIGSTIVLFYCLKSLVKVELIKYLSIGALIACTYGMPLFFSGIQDPYFQYWPIRFFWPCLSVLIFISFARKRTVLKSALVSIVGAVGTVWNLDSGAAIILAFGGYLFFQIIQVLTPYRRKTSPSYQGEHSLAWDLRKSLIATALHILITAAVFACSVYILKQLSDDDAVINYMWLVEAHKIFSTLGYYLLPLPQYFSSWMVVSAIYAISILWVTANYWIGIRSSRLDTILYLSFLGIALFVYYVGRSHILNLVHAFWPVLLILGIWCDLAFRSTKARRGQTGQYIIAVTILSVLMYLVGQLFLNLPQIFHKLSSKYSSISVVRNAIITSEIDFIKRFSDGHDECLILSKRQGIYQAEAKLVSSFKGPGVGELVLTSDEEALKALISSKKVSCIFLGHNTSEVLAAQGLIDVINSNYLFMETNESNTLSFFENK